MGVQHELPTNRTTVIVEDTTEPGFNHPYRYVVRSIIWRTLTVTWKVNSDYTLEFEAYDDDSDGFGALQQGHLLYAVDEDWIITQVEDTTEAGYAHTLSVKCTQITSEFSRFYYRRNAYAAAMAHTWTPRRIANSFFSNEFQHGNDWFTKYHLGYNVFGNFDARPVTVDTGSFTNILDTIRKTWPDCVTFPTHRVMGIYTRDAFYKDRGHRLDYMHNVANVQISIDKTTIVNRVRAVGPGISDDDLDSPNLAPWTAGDWTYNDLLHNFFGNMHNAGLQQGQAQALRNDLETWHEAVIIKSDIDDEAPADEDQAKAAKDAYAHLKTSADAVATWLTKVQGDMDQTHADVVDRLKDVLSEDMDIAGKIDAYWSTTTYTERAKVLADAGKDGGPISWMAYMNAKRKEMWDDENGFQTNNVDYGYLYYKPFLVWNQASIDKYGVYDGPDVTSDTITSVEAMKVKAESTLKPEPTMSLTCTMMSNDQPIPGDIIHFFNYLTGYQAELPVVGYVWKPFVLDDNTQLTLNTVEKDMLDYSNSMTVNKSKHTTLNISSGIEEVPWTEDAVNDFLNTIKDPTMQEGVPDEDQ